MHGGAGRGSTRGPSVMSLGSIQSFIYPSLARPPARTKRQEATCRTQKPDAALALRGLNKYLMQNSSGASAEPVGRREGAAPGFVSQGPRFQTHRVPRLPVCCPLGLSDAGRAEKAATASKPGAVSEHRGARGWLGKEGSRGC